MSTRAIYTFKDDHSTLHVYKHHDGYPSGAIAAIRATLKNAWDLPRFEADEFGAAFIAANKTHSGGIRLLKSGRWQSVAPGNIEYRYEITCKAGKLHVKAYEVCCDWDSGKWSQTLIADSSDLESIEYA